MSQTITPAVAPESNGTSFLKSLPAWARWSGATLVGLLILTIVQSVSGTTLLTADTTASAMIRWSIPILLAGLGGLFSERSGVVNIGLEGMMIFGTWFAAWGALNWGPWGGLIAGILGGALGGLLHAVATVTFGVDQIVSGVAINILAPGLTRYLSERIFTGQTGGSVSQSPRVNGFSEFEIPIIADALGWVREREIFFISDIAGILRGFVIDLSIFTLLALALVPISAWVLWRTRVGLRIRICGEHPSAAESLGVKVYRHKYLAVVISGAFAGMAGAFIVLELSGLYRGGQTTGRGFIGLAALIFGNWKALGVLTGSLLFSYPFGLALKDFDATSSGTATRALLLVVAIGLYATTVWLWRGRDTIKSDLEDPTGTWAKLIGGVRADERTGLTVLAAGLGTIALLWYLLTDSAASWLPNTMPYVLVLLVLIFAAQRLRPPKAVGIPFRKGDH
ncbi:MAG: ABC transporter permease [Ilumatobacter coccineus]|uniref:ABC transporter permease n=1 Tax=Ilumatobacter coccineus TaxID=467094 RepID=A0A2G6KAJ1_9ACTN|nr:MAG: ABC transporter permease [Ilumatobacter coccineus]